MENYVAYHLNTADDVIIALLSAFEFESFCEEDGKTTGYIAESNLVNTANDIDALLSAHGIAFSKEHIAPQNWNALWESSFQPVEVNQFCCVRADFHPYDEKYTHDIIINPKMAFGTGHHATTWMMMAQMKPLKFEGKKVLDYGAGTGILAILASKCGAAHSDAVDIELEAFHNMAENFDINHIANVLPIHGTLGDIDAQARYDIILANINRNILLDSAEQLYQHTNTPGTILLSGILEEDQEIIKTKFTGTGFRLVDAIQRDSWACMRFEKEPGA